MFDKFCLLSLTHRRNGFITMLAPIRDHLAPPNPESSTLLCSTRDCYFTRLLSVNLFPGKPGFEEARWIVSEDVNVGHLLDVFMSVVAKSDTIIEVCVNFLEHLYWYNGRYTVLGSKIEGLPDDHRLKSKSLIELSRLSHILGNYLEEKQLLLCILQLKREREEDYEVASVM